MNTSGGGVYIYVHDSASYHVILKSSNQDCINNIDYILIELPEYRISLCCMYCPPKSKVSQVINVINLLKLKSNSKFHFVAVGDFNINLMDTLSNLCLDFLNDLH